MKSVTLKVNGVEYLINTPTVGQYMTIESNKISLSKGEYGGLCATATASAAITLDLIDMVAVLTVMCPDLVSSIKTENILSINIADVKTLMESYNRDVKEFADKWIFEFRKAVDADKSGSTNNSTTK